MAMRVREAAMYHKAIYLQRYFYNKSSVLEKMAYNYFFLFFGWGVDALPQIGPIFQFFGEELVKCFLNMRLKLC